MNRQDFGKLERMITQQQDRSVEQDRVLDSLKSRIDFGEDDVSVYDDKDVDVESESEGDMFVSQLVPPKPRSKGVKSKPKIRKGV